MQLLRRVFFLPSILFVFIFLSAPSNSIFCHHACFCVTHSAHVSALWMCIYYIMFFVFVINWQSLWIFSLFHRTALGILVHVTHFTHLPFSHSFVMYVCISTLTHFCSVLHHSKIIFKFKLILYFEISIIFNCIYCQLK